MKRKHLYGGAVIEKSNLITSSTKTDIQLLWKWTFRHIDTQFFTSIRSFNGITNCPLAAIDGEFNDIIFTNVSEKNIATYFFVAVQRENNHCNLPIHRRMMM